MDPFSEARAQACEHVGFMASKIITVGDETFEIPNPSLLSDEQQSRYDQLQLDMETDDELDRHPDVKTTDGETVSRGAPKEPLRTKEGKLVESYNTRLAKAIFGPQQFKKFLNLGGRSADVVLYWTEMSRTVSERARDDSKSVAGNTGLAAVPDSD